MTAKAGMDAVMNLDGTPITGVRVSGFARDAQPIDITDRSSGGFPEMMPGKTSSRSLSFNVDGVQKDLVLEGIALDPDADCLLTNVSFDLTSGYTLAGDFWFGNYQGGNDHKDATTFQGSFTSSGKWSYTATV